MSLKNEESLLNKAKSHLIFTFRYLLEIISDYWKGILLFLLYAAGVLVTIYIGIIVIGSFFGIGVAIFLIIVVVGFPLFIIFSFLYTPMMVVIGACSFRKSLITLRRRNIIVAYVFTAFLIPASGLQTFLQRQGIFATDLEIYSFLGVFLIMIFSSYIFYLYEEGLRSRSAGRGLALRLFLGIPASLIMFLRDFVAPVLFFLTYLNHYNLDSHCKIANGMQPVGDYIFERIVDVFILYPETLNSIFTEITKLLESDVAQRLKSQLIEAWESPIVQELFSFIRRIQLPRLISFEDC